MSMPRSTPVPGGKAPQPRAASPSSNRLPVPRPCSLGTTAEKLDPTVLRTALRKAFYQNIAGGSLTGTERRAMQWIERDSLPVRALSDDAAATDMLNALATNLDGKPAAPDYVARRRRVIRTCLNFAVRKKRLTANPLASRNLPGNWRPPEAEEQVDPRAQSPGTSWSPKC